MEQTKQPSALRRATDKVFGGLNMSWPVVIISAVAAAVLTAVFLILPVFEKTSFYNIGVTFEAWIFFAVIIMSNCKKPLESGLKTFVFFLISQPLIYLLQVPFSWQGWNLFGYYGYWFILTVLTFPAAMLGWFIKKKNWISLLILSPVLIFLAVTAAGAFSHAFRHFPYQLLCALFCLAQILLYAYTFTSNLAQKLIGILVPVAVCVVILLIPRQFDISGDFMLPNEITISDAATVEVETPDGAEITIDETGSSPIMHLHVTAFGETDFTIHDGDKDYRYTVRVYEDEDGHSQIETVERK